MRETQIVERLLEELAVYHPPSRGHAERTARYAVALGVRLRLSDRELTQLRHAGLLHDLGTLTLPEFILRKQGPLTADEYALVQSHPRVGAERLKEIPFLRIPALWIAHHHERWDGYGYPYGLPGPLIPLGARILAVADTFDALQGAASAEDTPAGSSALQALRIMAGTQLDPDLVTVFLDVMMTQYLGRPEVSR